MLRANAPSMNLKRNHEGHHERSGELHPIQMISELSFLSLKESLTLMNFLSGWILWNEFLTTKRYLKRKRWSWWPWGYANMRPCGGPICATREFVRESPGSKPGVVWRLSWKLGFYLPLTSKITILTFIILCREISVLMNTLGSLKTVD